MIFAEHQKLKEENTLLWEEIGILTKQNDNLKTIDSLRVKDIEKYNANIEKLNKSIKTKNLLITSLSGGFLLSLIMFILK